VRRRNRFTPRAWGHRRGDVPVGPPRRFTPTCVGHRCYHVPALGARRFTPRALGHRVGVNLSRCPAVHPHLRGTSWRQVRRWQGSTVHPTTRGDITPTKCFADSHAGSPPRAWGHRHAMRLAGCETSVHPHVRGTSGCASRFDLARRFTPTCVGTSWLSRSGCR